MFEVMLKAFMPQLVQKIHAACVHAASEGKTEIPIDEFIQPIQEMLEAPYLEIDFERRILIINKDKL